MLLKDFKVGVQFTHAGNRVSHYRRVFTVAKVSKRKHRRTGIKQLHIYFNSIIKDEDGIYNYNDYFVIDNSNKRNFKLVKPFKNLPSEDF